MRTSPTGNYNGVSYAGMGRPRTINPKTGKVRRFSLMLAEPDYERLRKEAERRGVSVAELMRERLAKAS